MKKEYSCPDCGETLEEVTACGSESYFCHNCKSVKSRSKIEGHPNNSSSKTTNFNISSN